MSSGTWIALANLTLTTTDSSVEFASIPDTYRDLVLVAQTQATGNTYHRIRMNGDTGSNYSKVKMAGNSAGAQSSTQSGNTIDLVDINSSSFSIDIIHFLDASATDKHKMVIIRSNQTGTTETAAHVGRYASTSRITSITISPNALSYAAGSTFCLYGIVS